MAYFCFFFKSYCLQFSPHKSQPQEKRRWVERRQLIAFQYQFPLDLLIKSLVLKARL